MFTQLFALIISILILFGYGFLTFTHSLIYSFGHYHLQLFIEEKKWRFFFFPILKKIFKKNFISAFADILSLSRLLLVFSFIGAIIIFFNFTHLSIHLLILLSVLFFLVDFIARLSGATFFLKTASFFVFFSSIYLFITGIIVVPLVFLKNSLVKLFPKKVDIYKTPVLQDKIFNILEESGLSKHLSSSEQRLITSFITFKEKVAREVMIPRIDLFCMAHDTSIQEAASKFIEEDYSRVPIYKDSLDNIIGVLLYKDILKILAQNDTTLLKNTIDTLAKPVLYAPENKKISELFQEFRKKQSHLAIIVDEYGGTEGIVTIEDILEELVGEIEDEYDVDDKRQFWKLPSGSFIVDAKMTLLDIANKLGIHIPTSTEYETIGGYIFHVTGTIPSKGWTLTHDDFTLEVLISSERCIEKIRITPQKKELK